MNKIITIGRQFGSGGCEIGKCLAEKLGIDFYDKNIIEIAAEKSGINKKMFEEADEKHNSFLYSLSMAHYGGLASPVYLNDVITHDKLFLIQANIIKELAEKPCVIVGRCADDILRDYCKTFNVFVHADKDFRIDRISKLYELITYVREQNCRRIPTGLLNDMLAEAVAKVQPPSDKGKRLKIFYITQAAVCPPTFVCFVNNSELYHFSYQRYIENQIRSTFGLEGTPIKIISRERGDSK